MGDGPNDRGLSRKHIMDAIDASLRRLGTAPIIGASKMEHLEQAVAALDIALDAPIIGASKMEHLEQAVAALDIALDDQERSFLEELYKPHPVLGHS